MAQWTVEREIAATTVDVLGLLLNVYMQANTKEGTDVGDPLRFPRPYDDADIPRPARRMSSPAEIAAFAGNGGGSIRYAPGTAEGTPTDGAIGR